jgi:hypothetical protein
LSVVRNRYSTSATPTSKYGVQRQYHPASNHSSSSGGMAQSTSPSIPLQDGRSDHHVKSDQDVPMALSTAAWSTTLHNRQYSSYPPQQERQHGYPSYQGGAMCAQPRHDWAGYAGHLQHPIQGGYAVTGAQTPTSTAPAGARRGQVSTPPNQLPPQSTGHGVAEVPYVCLPQGGSSNPSTPLIPLRSLKCNSLTGKDFLTFWRAAKG